MLAAQRPQPNCQVEATPGAPREALSVGQVLRTIDARELARRGWEPSRAQQAVLRHVSECRTAAYGGHVDYCERCGYERPSYNSCRDRHCPSCQGHKGREWVEARRREVLPVRYFHIVFTLPGELAKFTVGNKKVVYNALFAAASDTLQEVAKRRLGVELGVMAVLHTWSQALLEHPHVHCVVPGGGLAEGGAKWVSSPRSFFLPVRVLRQVYRAKVLAKLKEAYTEGALELRGKWSKLATSTAFAGWLGMLREKTWVVYAKKPFGGPDQVLKYLARYTHKVAISNSRLTRFEHSKVTFRYRDRKLYNAQREMTLDAEEFARRFLLHVLPKGRRRIRYYGFLGNGCRTAKLARCRELLGARSGLDHGAAANGTRRRRREQQARQVHGWRAGALPQVQLHAAAANGGAQPAPLRGGQEEEHVMTRRRMTSRPRPNSLALSDPAASALGGATSKFYLLPQS